MQDEWTSPDGRIRLINADARDVLRTLDAGSVDMIWTDPPYGHSNMDGDLQAARVRDGVKGARVREAQPIANDGPEAMRAVVDAVLSEASRVLNRDCCCCCCCCGGGGPKPTFAWVAERMDRDGLQFFHAIVWDKSARGNGMGWRYRRNYEFVMVSHRKGGKLLWADDDSAVPNIVRRMPVLERQHPNEKPVDMVADFIRWHSDQDMLICDPFGGSMSTAVAAIRTGRRCLAIELDPAHFATGVKRCQREYARTVLFNEAEAVA
jgi:DNA modification methylase